MTTDHPSDPRRGQPVAPRERGSSGEIRTLQYGRGVAALLVVLFHADILATKYFGPSAEGAAFRGGHSGVEFFFVLSGFIILAAHRGDLGRAGRLRPYLVKRFVRVVPLYWVVMVPYGLAFLFVPSLNAERGVTLAGIARDLVFLSPETALTLPPAWTLQHELLFYAVFAVAICNLRLGALVFAAWQMSCAAFLLWSTALHTYAPPADTVLGFFNFGFLFGIALAWRPVRAAVARNVPIGCGLGLVGVALVALLLTLESRSEAAVLGPPAVLTLSYLAGYGLVIVGLLAVPNVPRPRLDATLGLLGSASYAIYLVHLPAGSLALKILTNAQVAGMVGPQVAFLAVAAAGVGAGLVLHLVVERPLLRSLRTRLVPGGERRPAPALEASPSFF